MSDEFGHSDGESKIAAHTKCTCNLKQLVAEKMDRRQSVMISQGGGANRHQAQEWGRPNGRDFER